MTFSRATRKDHEKFCTIGGWIKRKTATGKTGTHHVNYEFALADGNVLFTRISHSVDRTDYGASLWANILRDQLDVTAQEFWECVYNRVKPNRFGLFAEHPKDAIPIAVVTTLIEQFHVPEAEVRAMTKDQAIERMLLCYEHRRAAPPGLGGPS